MAAHTTAHNTAHQNGGADEISVADLSGLLADSQTPLAHKTSHQFEGTDELSIAGLSGESATAQPPKVHGSDHLNSTDPLKIVGQNTSGVSVGDLCYLSAADTWSQTDANAEATAKGMIGICLVSNVSIGEVLKYGAYTTTGLTAANNYYISGTAGEWTNVAPSASGDIVRIVGYALNTTTLFFEPDCTYIEVT